MLAVCLISECEDASHFVWKQILVTVKSSQFGSSVGGKLLLPLHHHHAEQSDHP